MKTCVDRKKALISSVTCLLCGFLTVLGILESAWIAAVMFLAFALLWGAELLRNAASVVICAYGVKQQLFGRTIKQLSWEEIQEVGVLGTRVFGDKKKRRGTLYLYFSGEKLDDEKRFAMVLQWPPREQIYVRYQRDLRWAVARWRDGEIERYNTGDSEV